MRNLILQHFDGELRDLDRLSINNMKEYAKLVDADYSLVRGKPFRSNLTGACQKVFMLDKVYDKYEDVLMVDIDMFAPRHMSTNIFEEKGIGLYEDVQKRLHQRLTEWHPMLSSMNAPYWGGAIYKMDKQTRKTLREQLGGNEGWMLNFNKAYNYEDEGIMHVLAFKSGLKPEHPYLDRKWCQCSFLPNAANAGFIHIRTKITPTGPKQEKMLNYKRLVAQGIL